MDLNERKLKILHAIIRDFVMTAEPVGSRTLSKKYDLGVSAATIRNEMSDLEELGYLSHPHTSAGRIPSEKAYRLYVNQIMKKQELSEAEKQIIATKLLHNMNELDKTIEQAANILSSVTNLMAFALTPNPDQDILKCINILPVDQRTVVLMIVAESGKISNTTLRLNVPYTEESLRILSKSMTYNFQGKTLCEALKVNIIETLQTDLSAISALAQDILPNFIQTLEEMLDVKLYVDGITNIFSIPEYNDLDKAKLFVEMVNKKEELTKTIISRDNGLLITIGNENLDQDMKDCSLITATYHVDGKLLGKLGVIGPTRMKYGEISSVIEYLSENISNAFQVTGGKNDED